MCLLCYFYISKVLLQGVLCVLSQVGKNRRERCAAGPAFSVGNTLKAKLEWLETCMLQNLGSLLRENIEASSQSFRGCVLVPVG